MVTIAVIKEFLTNARLAEWAVKSGLSISTWAKLMSNRLTRVAHSDVERIYLARVSVGARDLETDQCIDIGLWFFNG